MRAMFGAGPGLLRLDAGTAMRDNSLKAAGGGSSGALAKEKAATGGADVVDAKESKFSSALTESPKDAVTSKVRAARS